MHFNVCICRALINKNTPKNLKRSYHPKILDSSEFQVYQSDKISGPDQPVWIYLANNARLPAHYPLCSRIIPNTFPKRNGPHCRSCFHINWINTSSSSFSNTRLILINANSMQKPQMTNSSCTAQWFGQTWQYKSLKQAAHNTCLKREVSGIKELAHESMRLSNTASKNVSV